MQHEIFRQLFDGWLSLAPLTSTPKYVLDIGTGTGIWATEFGESQALGTVRYHHMLMLSNQAEQNPSSYVIGTDLSAIQPTPCVPNCMFLKDDAESPWYFEDPVPNHSKCEGPCQHWIQFDYIHLRLMFTCFNDVRTVMRSAFNNMSPGGWVEFQESSLDYGQANKAYSGTYKSTCLIDRKYVNRLKGTAFTRYTEACAIGAAAMGRDLRAAKHYQGWLEEIGCM